MSAHAYDKYFNLNSFRGFGDNWTEVVFGHHKSSACARQRIHSIFQLSNFIPLTPCWTFPIPQLRPQCMDIQYHPQLREQRSARTLVTYFTIAMILMVLYSRPSLWVDFQREDVYLISVKQNNKWDNQNQIFPVLVLNGMLQGRSSRMLYLLSQRCFPKVWRSSAVHLMGGKQ